MTRDGDAWIGWARNAAGLPDEVRSVARIFAVVLPDRLIEAGLLEDAVTTALAIVANRAHRGQVPGPGPDGSSYQTHASFRELPGRKRGLTMDVASPER